MYFIVIVIKNMQGILFIINVNHIFLNIDNYVLLFHLDYECVPTIQFQTANVAIALIGTNGFLPSYIITNLKKGMPMLLLQIVTNVNLHHTVHVLISSQAHQLTKRQTYLLG